MLWSQDNSTGSTTYLPKVDGQLFCSLPLPYGKTGLPLHVDGKFLLQSNRRALFLGTDNGGIGQQNLDIFERHVAPLWVKLLRCLAQRCTGELVRCGRFALAPSLPAWKSMQNE